MAPAATVEEVERRVTTRMQRQGVLENLALWAILDEAAVRRQVGTPEEMREQITHLREANQRPGVTLQIHPFDAGPHPALLGSFVLAQVWRTGTYGYCLY